jgi:hypothetical protein
MRVCRRFGGMYRLYVQGRSAKTVLSVCYRDGILLGSFFDPEDEGDMFLRNVVDLERTTRRFMFPCTVRTTL